MIKNYLPFVIIESKLYFNLSHCLKKEKCSCSCGSEKGRFKKGSN